MGLLFYFISGEGINEFPMVYVALLCIPIFILIFIVMKWRIVWRHGPGNTGALLKCTFLIFCISSFMGYQEFRQVDKQSLMMNIVGAGFESIGNRPFWMYIPEGDTSPEAREMEAVAKKNSSFTVKQVSCQNHDCIITVAINGTDRTTDFSLRTFLESGATIKTSYSNKFDAIQNMVANTKKGLDVINDTSTPDTDQTGGTSTQDEQGHISRTMPLDTLN